MPNRIDLIGQNGGTGDHYLVEQVCRIIAGDRAERSEFPTIEGKRVLQKGWQVHIQQALNIIDAVRGHDKLAEYGTKSQQPMESAHEQ